VTSYLFAGPTTTLDEQPFKTLEDPWPLGKQVPRDVGLTVYRLAGVWHAEQSTSEEIEAAADRLYFGGHVYTVDQDAADELTAAGFGANLTPI
jgi:hypothetical protein